MGNHFPLYTYLFGTIQVCVKEYRELNISDTFISFMIPIVYLLLIVPLEYALELYSKYEMLFIRMNFKEPKDKKIQKSHRWRVVRICKLSVYRVLLFQRKFLCKMYWRMPEDGFLDLLEEFKRECKKIIL